MNLYDINGFSFAYTGEKKPALNNISLTVNQGEFLLICGESGCGKSTFLKCFKSALSPKGVKSGSVFYRGADLDNTDSRKQAKEIGFVLQNPESQTVTDKVWHEMAFGLESLGVESGEIRLKIAEMSAFFGIEDWFHKDISELSGGQKQLLNLASVMVMNPEVIILDEPTAQLDPIAASGFLETVKKINRELGTTVIMAEHRTEEAFNMADRVIFMDGGEIRGEITPSEINDCERRTLEEMHDFLPSPVRIWLSVKSALKCPLTVGEAKKWLYEYSRENYIEESVPVEDRTVKDGENAVEIKNIYFRYERDMPDVIKNASLTVKEGEWLAVMGGNGAGKTTLLSLISALNTPYAGKIKIFGRNIKEYGSSLYNGVLGYVPQNPQTLFVKNSVEDELVGDDDEVCKIIKRCRLESVLKRHPYDISGGEQQRLAMAKVLLKKPRIMLLDEPTKGLDRSFKRILAQILEELVISGVTVIMVSHDIEFCAEYAHKCALVFDGAVVSEDTPQRFFGGKNFYTTTAEKISRGIIENAVTEGDIVRACGGKRFAALPKKESCREAYENKTEKNIAEEYAEKDNKIRKHKIYAAIITAVIIPLTVIFGLRLFGDRRYYLVSMAVVIEALLPFFGVFEGRKPSAREVVILAVMCTLGSVGRAAFFMIPQFKPMAAIVIISGAAFGAERGFMVGALSMLVSNMIFGQGPWTPWQMFAMGFVGFLSGILFENSKRNRYLLAVYGFVSVLCIYGLIMNVSSAVMFQPDLNLALVISYVITGLPFDIIHAVSTAVFLIIIAKPILEKLDRIKLKHGFG